MLHVRTFETADELMAHYRALKNRQQSKRFQPAPAPIEVVEDEEPAKPVVTLTEEQIEQVVEERLSYASSRNAARQIVREITDEFAVTWAEIVSPRRNSYIVRARHKMFWRLKNETIWSLPQIGRYVNKDHTTVLHGIRRFELDALHRRNGWSTPSSKEFELYQKLGCRAQAYLAARGQQ